MRFDEYRQFDATGLATLVAQKEVTAAELLALATERLQQVNPQINAVVARCDRRAARHAKSVVGNEPFSGVPFLIKDLGTHVKGVPTTDGSRLLRDSVADHDSELTKRFEGLGMPVLGKTNTPEMGLTITTEPVLHGPTRNPWHLERTPGGSSGGAAAAVAAGIVPMAHGSDGGGSIRVPASCCGLVGLKPSRARLPVGPDVGEAWSGMVSHHVLTRSIRDCARVLHYCQGEDLGAPYYGPPRQDFIAALREPERPLRIAYFTASPNQCLVDAEVIAAVENAAHLCRQAGHDVIEQSPQIEASGFTRAFNVIMASNTLYELNRAAKKRQRQWDDADVEGLTRHIAGMGKAYDAQAYVEALQTMHRIGREMAHYQQEVDILISPVIALKPFNLGYLDTNMAKIATYFDRLGNVAPFTSLYNVTGQPAISLPLSWSRDGLPIGVQFAAPFGREDWLINLAW